MRQGHWPGEGPHPLLLHVGITSVTLSASRPSNQDARQNQLDQCCLALSKLLQDQLFLTSMVHALEEQKSFTIKDKSVAAFRCCWWRLHPPHPTPTVTNSLVPRRCTLASLLTVALHSELPYLTDVMEALLKDLMQKSNAQPKLLLRRTEFTVEKLLTNWMSICLYGFLRVSSSQPIRSEPARYWAGGCGIAPFFGMRERNKNFLNVRVKQLAGGSLAFLPFWTGGRRPAAVPDGERSHAADCQGTSGLRDGESSVHSQ